MSRLTGDIEGLRNFVTNGIMSVCENGMCFSARSCFCSS